MESVLALPDRPEAPLYLTDEEAQVWREVVTVKPADWFARDSQPVLAAYCNAVCMHRVLVNKWHTIDETIPAKEMKVIVELVNKTATLIAGLATKLRLTNQSRYTPQAANTASKKSTPLRPWETAKAG